MRGARSAILIFLLLLPNPAAAGDGPIVALFDLQDKGAGLPAQVAENLIDFLAARLAQGGYQIVPRDQVKQRLRQAASDSFKSCYDQSCQIELGRELAAQKTLATQVLRIGDSCQVTASLYDLLRATSELAATAEARCTEESSLLDAVKSIGEQLTQPLQESKKETVNRLGELDRTLADTAAPRGERLAKAWELARRIAEDSMVPGETRAAVVKKFLDAFPGDNPNQDAARTLLAAFLPGNLLVKSEPPGALIAIDGKPIGVAPLGRELKQGDHQVDGTLDGYLSARRKVTVASGQQGEVVLTLPPPPAHPLRTTGRVLFWGGLGVAALGGAAGGLANREWQEWRQTADPAHEDRGDTWHTVMLVGLGSGAALAAAGMVLWLLEPDQTDWAAQWNREHPLSLGPTPGGGVAISFTRSFP